MEISWSRVTAWALQPTPFTAAVNFVLFAAVLVPVEWLCRPAARRTRRPGLRTDLLFWVFTPLVGKAATYAAVTAVVAGLMRLTGRDLEPFSTAGGGGVGRQPLWLQAAEVLVLADLVFYWTHRLFHTTRMWPFHAVHHSSEHLDWVSSMRFHPVNDIVSRVFQAVPLVLLGFAPAAVVCDPGRGDIHRGDARERAVDVGAGTARVRKPGVPPLAPQHGAGSGGQEFRRCVRVLGLAVRHPVPAVRPPARAIRRLGSGPPARVPRFARLSLPQTRSTPPSLRAGDGREGEPPGRFPGGAFATSMPLNGPLRWSSSNPGGTMFFTPCTLASVTQDVTRLGRRCDGVRDNRWHPIGSACCSFCPAPVTSRTESPAESHVTDAPSAFMSSLRLPLAALALLFASVPVRAADPLEAAFDRDVKPFLKQYCVRCHNADKQTSGVRVDHLDAKLEDRHLKLWEHVLNQTKAGAMPPEEAKQPTADERKRAVEWIGTGAESGPLCGRRRRTAACAGSPSPSTATRSANCSCSKTTSRRSCRRTPSRATGS